MNQYILCSDLHGCYLTFLALLKKCPVKTHEIIILGDFIDRQSRTREIVEFLIRNKIRCVKGNHESLMLNALGLEENPLYDRDSWIWNGGGQTMKSYNKVIPEEHKKWILGLPYYFKFDNLLVSHTGWGLLADLNTRNAKNAAIWKRETDFPKDGLFRVFGHTPEKEPIITETWAMIDTGCAYSGKLTAFLWPSKECIFQENCD